VIKADGKSVFFFQSNDGLKSTLTASVHDHDMWCVTELHTIHSIVIIFTDDSLMKISPRSERKYPSVPDT
jgi:hypothetical protein